ncbi:MAG: hypothetical protein DRP09_03430 [Candidatus Thorarchaeota archaeon]|nr:MAG: hypothetical protein DRP09_03430 [Candidatus Thorarchaeota archaeon]
MDGMFSSAGRTSINGRTVQTGSKCRMRAFCEGAVSLDSLYTKSSMYSMITMTVQMDSAYVTMNKEETPCGRCSCIILYSSPKCLLCDAALEILLTVISDFGLSPSVIRKVDIESGHSDGCETPPPVGLPAIRICDELLTGLPDMDVTRGAVMHAVLRGCFFEGR